ncbi:WD repeat protein [Trichodelitschia bisporula]|uniref:WD repeat protein n=1 Tax=Trichodelitschia bisporula TaxID=703511 RepID=A0A6G1HS95_9PEZI|nr:WD repeat protein [Trichodelitschia bisporula]
MKLSTHSAVPVYTIAGSSTARPLPDWLIRKRKRSLKQDPEFANRIELLQDFEFEESSSCVRVSEDGNWVMSTGTYKPQIHTHYLPHLALSFARHTDTLNQTFILLSSDYSKSLHLQTDRYLEFQSPGGCHYKTRIPRYGRDLVYDRRSAEALVPSVGLNAEGNGEVFRLNLELGRFMKGYEVDVGGDDPDALNSGTLQGSLSVGAVNTAAVAEESHNLLAFGTSLGTVEFFDPRSRSRIGILSLPRDPTPDSMNAATEVTALSFRRDGLTLATGSSTGLIHLYDLRSPVPLLKKDQGYGYPIQTLKFLESSSRTRAQTTDPKILSADKRIIKLWDPTTGDPWTAVEPAVDLNHVEWCSDSGMLLTANEGKQQHAFFIPQLGPAPKWCAFLDNLVEELAEDPTDPSAFSTTQQTGAVYDNFKFLTPAQLRVLNIDHLVGQTALLRPYMHGFFVAQKLYEEAALLSNPTLWADQRAKSIKARIDKERESRIRGAKKVAVKVNRRLAERVLEREAKNEARRARRVLKQGGDEPAEPKEVSEAEEEEEVGGDAVDSRRPDILTDDRFARLFQDEAFEINERSAEFRSLNPSTLVRDEPRRLPKGLTAVEEAELEEARRGNEDSSGSESEESEGGGYRRKTQIADRKKSAAKARAEEGPRMVVSSAGKSKPKMEKAFGDRVGKLKDKSAGVVKRGVVGEREVSFMPQGRKKPPRRDEGGERDKSDKSEWRKKERRSASGNTMLGRK